MKKTKTLLVGLLCVLSVGFSTLVFGACEETVSNNSTQSSSSFTNSTENESSSSGEETSEETPPQTPPQTPPETPPEEVQGSEGLEYELSEDETYYIVTDIGECKDTDIVIPSEYKSKPVKAVDYGAFQNSSDIKSVVIGDNVLQVGPYAFDNCDALESVTVGTNTKRISGYAFSDCLNLRHIELSDSLTTICEGAFEYCLNLTDIVIPDSVIKIEKYAFRYCSYLENIRFGKNLTEIGANIFKECSSLSEIELPDSLISIGGGAFYNCTALKSIIIPDNVTSIGAYAFNECENLTSVTIGNSVSSILDYAFYKCYNIENVYINDIANWCNIAFHDEDSNPLDFGVKLYADNTLLTYFIVPTGVTNIGDYAFDAYTYLTYVDFGEEVETIGTRAFSDCDGLTQIEIPDNITNIGKLAFWCCHNLTSLTIPKGIAIGYEAFKGCVKLVEVYDKSELSISAGIEENGYVGYYAKNIYTPTSGQSKLSTDNDGYIIYTDSVDKILVAYAGTDIALTLPSAITEVYKFAFCDRQNLVSVVIGDNVKRIGKQAFSLCENLTSVIFRNSNGWIVEVNSWTSYNLSTEDLSNKATAAEYLRDTYQYASWVRTDT